MAADTDAMLAAHTSPGLIIPALRGVDAPAVIQELSAAIQREGHIPDLLPFYQAALNREYLCSTVTEPGWALLHVLVKGLDKPCFALGRTTAPIAWGNSVLRVQLIFLLAAPETDARAYMTLILGLSRLSRDSRLFDQLLKAKGSLEIFELLRQVGTPVNRTVL
jgi:mannitol/fructose-specific phosphotransferase system IIA component (Ntr-type)